MNRSIGVTVVRFKSRLYEKPVPAFGEGSIFDFRNLVPVCKDAEGISHRPDTDYILFVSASINLIALAQRYQVSGGKGIRAVEAGDPKFSITVEGHDVAIRNPRRTICPPIRSI